MSLSIDALTSALLGCHQSAHCAPAVSGWRRLTERRRRLVTSVKVSFLYPPPVSSLHRHWQSIMITTQPYTNHDNLIDWILSTYSEKLNFSNIYSWVCGVSRLRLGPVCNQISVVCWVLATFPSKITQFLSYQISARQWGGPHSAQLSAPAPYSAPPLPTVLATMLATRPWEWPIVQRIYILELIYWGSAITPAEVL